MLSVTIVTHAAMPCGAPDDLLLAAALRARGAEVRFAVWSDNGIDWRATDCTVIRSTWDYHLVPAAWFAWLDRIASHTRLINPAPLVRWNSDKAYLLDLDRAGIPVIPTILLDDASDLAALCDERGWNDIVLKPAIGASSTGARRFRGGAIPVDGIAHLAVLLRAGRVLLQPYQQAIEIERERSLVYIGSRFSHAFSKPGFHAGLGGDLRLHRPSQDERRLGDTVLAALPQLPPPLVSRIDILPGRSGPLLMEAELIEPQLALHLHGPAAGMLAELLIRS